MFCVPTRFVCTFCVALVVSVLRTASWQLQLMLYEFSSRLQLERLRELLEQSVEELKHTSDALRSKSQETELLQAELAATRYVGRTTAANVLIANGCNFGKFIMVIICNVSWNMLVIALITMREISC